MDEKRRSDTAIEMVAARGDMSAEKVAAQIDEQIGYVSPKVLVVDDEANFRKLVSSALTCAVASGAAGSMSLRTSMMGIRTAVAVSRSGMGSPG